MLKKTCKACGKDRKKSKIMYDDYINAYCKNTHECNNEHPNSTINLIKNGKMIPLYDHDKAVEMFTKQNTSETIKYMASPITLRLSSVEQALHLDKVCEERNISISDYIRGLIESDMQTVKVEEEQAPIPTSKSDESELIF